MPTNQTAPETSAKLPPGLARVPAFPPVAARLLGLLSRESISLEEVADLIATDPLFSSRMLQSANSIEFGCSQRVTNIKRALLLLGIDRTRNLAVSLATAAYMRNALRAENLRRCWRHTVACAMISESIARAIGQYQDQAYTAGILHDIGRLGLVVAYPNEYENAIRNAAHRSIDMLDYEREIFGIDHAEAGRLLVTKWNLPDPFPLIAGRHHDRTGSSELDLLAVVSLACRMADMLGFEVTQPLRPLTLDDALAGLPEAVHYRLKTEAPTWRDVIERKLQAFEGAEPSHSEVEVPEAAAGNSPGIEADLQTLPAAPRTRISVYWRAAGWVIAAIVAAAAVFFGR